MALAVLLTQCRKPEVKFPTPSAADEGTTVSMTVTAGPGSKTDITTAGGITWSSGDKLYVGYNNKYVGYLTLVSGSGTPTGTFSGDVTLTGISDGEKTFHFFYLGSVDYTGSLKKGESATVAVSFASQEIYNNGGKLENASKHHVGYGTAKGTVSGGVVTGINVTLVSKVALARFSFKKNSTDYTDALTLSGTNIYNSMTVGFGGSFNHGTTSGSISLTGSHRERYVMLVPTGATEAQSLTFTGSSESGTGDVPGLQANKFYGKTDAIAVTLTATTIPVTSVSLDKTKLSLEVGANETLTATVNPTNATNKSVTWSSSAESVATVADGTVTAVAAGTATITVTTVDGNYTATCTVNVNSTHEYVDLGLPSGLLWATCNIGADSPEKPGDFFAWGETEPKSMTSSWSTYKWCDGSSTTLTKYNTDPNCGIVDNKTILDLDDDAAHVNWGGKWRMPTRDEMQELYANTTNSKEYVGGNTCWKFMNKTDESKYILIPSYGQYGRIWSSELATTPKSACIGIFDISWGIMLWVSSSERATTIPVRPVQSK